MLQDTIFHMESMPGKFTKTFVFDFNYNIWMNTFLQYYSLHICAVEHAFNLS